MSELDAASKLQKWPFYLADLVLSGIAVYVLYRLGTIQGTADIAIAIGCLFAAAWAAWLSITPWLVEYRTQSAQRESTNLRSSLEQIQSIEKVAELIRQANSQWQGVQDAAGRTVNSAREISEKMKVETDEFMNFIQNAHDQERAGLRLEVEKLRRMEGDWIKVSVQMLDHIYALARAAERSGQPQLISQLSQFQNACRDVARRMGLAPFAPALGETFDSRAHQLSDPQLTPPEGSIIGEILATGFTYQGQLLRRALVMVSNPDQAPPATEPGTGEAQIEPPLAAAAPEHSVEAYREELDAPREEQAQAASDPTPDPQPPIAAEDATPRRTRSKKPNPEENELRLF